MDITIINLNTTESVTFDNQNFILNSHNLNTFNVQHNKSRTIKQIGEYIESTNVNSRPVNFIGYLIAHSPLDLAKKKQLLLNITSPLSNLEIIANGKYKISGKCTSPVTWGSKWDNNNDNFVKFSIDLICPDTLWYDINPITFNLSPFINSFKFPVVITENFTFGHRAPDKLTQIYNPVNVSLPLQIEVSSSGDVKNPCISRLEGNENFYINKTIVPADNIKINTSFGHKSILNNGENIIGNVNLLKSKWLMIEPGLNTFGFSCENKDEIENLNVEITYKQAYWGVT